MAQETRSTLLLHLLAGLWFVVEPGDLIIKDIHLRGLLWHFRLLFFVLSFRVVRFRPGIFLVTKDYGRGIREFVRKSIIISVHEALLLVSRVL